MKVMEGDLKETLFAWPESGEEEKPLEVKNINNYKKDEVTYISGMCAKMCHRYASLHGRQKCGHGLRIRFQAKCIVPTGMTRVKLVLATSQHA